MIWCFISRFLEADLVLDTIYAIDVDIGGDCLHIQSGFESDTELVSFDMRDRLPAIELISCELLEKFTLMHTEPRPTLIAAASHFYQRGWMMGTAGNLSARMPDGSFWITASGCPKGQLTTNDFVHMTLNTGKGEVCFAPTQPHSDSRPSSETSIHAAIYALFPDAHACYHVHSIESNLVSRFVSGGALPLPPLEMLKGLEVWEEKPQVAMPVFTNYLEVPRIAREISARFKIMTPLVPALLIRDHGVTVWASSLERANNYLEVTEYIFRYMVAARKIGMGLG